VAGVAGGVSAKLRMDVTLVRVALVIFALVSGGVGFVVYVAAWLILPFEGGGSTIAAKAVSDRRGVALCLALVPALVVVLILNSSLEVGFVGTLAWPFFLSLAALILIYRNADEEEREFLQQTLDPVVAIGAGTRRSRRLFAARLGLGSLLLAGGALALVIGHPKRSALRPLGGVVLVLAAVVVLCGPWWLRLARELAGERQGRARAEERAEMATRVHDSVLQTLALIQRSADQPQKVAQLARRQERELRSWLFEGRPPGSFGEGGPETLAAGVGLIEQEVESSHDVAVDAVTVGDCALDDDLRALLLAGKEATVNAAKWSGAPTVSLFVEVEQARVSMFVRDRGVGFKPDAVASDRRGISESMRARMARRGGTVIIRSAPGAGTEVELSVPRHSGR
jgi:signal transduction histidine kinase